MRPHRYNTPNRYQLTDRQRHIMDLLAKRYTNQQIADDLGITLDGAKWHISEILQKLELESREDAADFWRVYNGAPARLRRAVYVLAWEPLRWVTVGAAIAGGIAAAGVIGALLMRSDDESPSAEPTPQVSTVGVDTGKGLVYVVDDVSYDGASTRVTYHLEGDLNGIGYLPADPNDPSAVPGIEVLGGKASGTVVIRGQPDVLRFPSAIRRVEAGIEAVLPIEESDPMIITTPHGTFTATWTDRTNGKLQLQLAGRDALATLSPGTTKGVALLDDLGNLYPLEHGNVSTPARWDDPRPATAVLTFDGTLAPGAQTVTLITQTYDALIIGDWQIPASSPGGP